MALTDVFLGALIPTTGLAAFYPLDNDTVGAFVINDESGNNRDVVPDVGLNIGLITADQINERKAVVYTGTTEVDAFQFVGALTIKDIFITAKVDDTPTFPATFPTLLSGIDSLNLGLLLGVNATTRWFDAGYSFNYYKSGTSFASGAMAAPFSYFEQMRINKSAGLALDGIQFGRDREDATRLFEGKWCDALFYTTSQGAAELARIKLYGDLKFGLWLLNGTALTFPTPSMLDLPGYKHFYAAPKQWDDAVTSHEYDDGGRSFNRNTDTPAREWNLEIDCVTATGTHAASKLLTDVYDAFWNAVGVDRTFSFTDKYGEIHTGVRIAEYVRNHSEHKSWIQSVSFRLVKFP